MVDEEEATGTGSKKAARQVIARIRQSGSKSTRGRTKVHLEHDNWLRSEVHNSSNLTVGILLTPSSSPPRPWDVTMAAVETLSLLSDQERALLIKITS